MPATRKQLLARLHCIKRDQGWSDDEYRDILQAKTGQRSAAKLEGPALARVVNALGGSGLGRDNRGQARSHNHEWSFVDSAVPARQRMLRKLIMLAAGAGIEKGKQVAYIEGIARQMNGLAHGADAVVKPLALCDEHELWCIVRALAIYVARKGKNPNDVHPEVAT